MKLGKTQQMLMDVVRREGIVSSETGYSSDTLKTFGRREFDALDGLIKAGLLVEVSRTTSHRPARRRGYTLFNTILRAKAA